MRNVGSRATLAAVASAALCGQVPHVDRTRGRDLPAAATRLVPFGSADALRSWFSVHVPAPPRYQGGSLDDLMNRVATPAGAAPTPSRPPPASQASNAPGARVAAGGSITNNQVEGADEGDIVKTHGDHLVILRRGRLFIVSTAGGGLRTISTVDAWGGGRAPGGWYDEMLVAGDTVVVVGYSYRAGATEVGLFDITAAGALRWRDTMFVRSGDYYSSRNYASRLVGHRLVMYMPVPLRDGATEDSLPAVRRGPDAPWETVLTYQRLYRPVQAVGYGPIIHTVMSCDLGGRGFDCGSVGVVGPASRNFYVSGTAVYLWVHSAPGFGDNGEPLRDRPPPPAVVYRLPLDGAPPGAVRVRGAPLDQFSFDERGETLRVMVRAEGGGDAMWRPEAGGGDLGFLRVPLARFRSVLTAMEGSAYRGLPRAGDAGTPLQNRFTDDRLIYGAGFGWRPARAASAPHPVWVYDAANDRAARVDVTHSVERIEPLGRDVLIVGNEAGGLTFSALALDETPVLAGRHTVRFASQGETRSHGFFFLPDGDRRGTLGLPITTGRDGGDWRQLDEVFSAVMFLRVDGLRFRELGALRGTPGAPDDRCVASCVDWYGNARPIFWRDRVFALLGYELVEGSLASGRASELRRLNFLTAQPAGPAGHSGNAFNHVAD